MDLELRTWKTRWSRASLSRAPKAYRRFTLPKGESPVRLNEGSLLRRAAGNKERMRGFSLRRFAFLRFLRLTGPASGVG